MKVSVELHDYVEMRYIDVRATNPFRDDKKDLPSKRREKRFFFRIGFWNFLFLTRSQLNHHARNRKSCQKLTALTSNLALVEIHSDGFSSWWLLHLLPCKYLYPASMLP
jgi:hypothetical protein